MRGVKENDVREVDDEGWGYAWPSIISPQRIFMEHLIRCTETTSMTQ